MAGCSYDTIEYCYARRSRIENGMNTGGITGFLSGYLGNSAVWNVEMASRSNSTGSGAIAGSASESCMYCCCAFDMAFDFPPENINFHGGLAGGARDSSLTKSYFCGSKDDPSIGGHLIGAAARITGDDNFIVSGAKALGNYSESDLTHSTIHEAAFTNGYLTERLGVSDWYEGPAGFPLPFEYSGTVEVTGVSLDLHSAALEKGAEIRLAAKVAPYNATDMEVVWQSYDKTVATVDSGGLVRAVGPGSATIRVKTKDGGFTDKCKIKVTSPVSEVTLDKSSVTVEKGRSVTLTARVEPSDATNPAVTWQSYDKTIATVDSAGKVTGVSSGSTTIRVKTKDGGYIAKCKVKVTEPVIPVTGVSL
ncbi:MAG: Ig domain-containing protein, partial [Abditibacteriota bacterium]|nr:Ig domain-containing protein [Abditibacteriota bacterium]